MEGINYVKKDLKSIKRIDPSEIDNLYNSDSRIKLKKKLEGLEKKVSEMRQQVPNIRLMDEMFGDNRLKKHFEQIEEIKEKINELKEQVKEIEDRKPDTDLNVERIYPSREVRNQIVEGNLYLCEAIAKKYYNKWDHKVSYDDLYQTACLGLISAARYYVPSNIAKFSTYASTCIENKLIRVYKPKKKENIPYNELLVELDILLDFLQLMKTGKYWQAAQYIKANNKKMFLMGLPKYSINKKACNKKEAQKLVWDYFTKLYNKVAKSMRLSLTITNEERNFISLDISHANLEGTKKRCFTLDYYIKYYMRKLSNALLYNKVIKELLEEDKPITDEEIIKTANKLIRRDKTKFNKIKKHLFNFNGIGLSDDVRIWNEYIEIYSRVYGIDKIWHDPKQVKKNWKREYYRFDDSPKPYEAELNDIYDEDEYYDDRNIVIEAVNHISYHLENEDRYEIMEELDNILASIKLITIVNPKLTEEFINSIYDIEDDDEFLERYKNELHPKLLRISELLNEEFIREKYIYQLNHKIEEFKENVENLNSKFEIASETDQAIKDACIEIITTLKSEQLYEILDEYAGGQISRLVKLDSWKLRNLYSELSNISNKIIEEIDKLKEEGDYAYRNAPRSSMWGNDELNYNLLKIVNRLNPEDNKEFDEYLIANFKEAYDLVKDLKTHKITNSDFLDKFSQEPLNSLNAKAIELTGKEDITANEQELKRIIKTINESTEICINFIKRRKKDERIVETSIFRILDLIHSRDIAKCIKPGYDISKKTFKKAGIESPLGFYDDVMRGVNKTFKETKKKIEVAETAIKTENDLIKDSSIQKIVDILNWNSSYNDRNNNDLLDYMKKDFPELYELIDRFESKKISKRDFFLKFREEPYQKLLQVNEAYQAKENTFRSRYAEKVMKERKKHVRKLTKEITSGIFEENREFFNLSLFEKLGIKKWNEATLEEIKTFYQSQVEVDSEFLESITSKKEYQLKQTLEEEVETKLFLDDYSKCLSELTSIERKVLTMYLDENGIRSYTPKEISKELNIPVREVTKIKTKALRKIRKNPIMEKYKDSLLD